MSIPDPLSQLSIRWPADGRNPRRAWASGCPTISETPIAFRKCGRAFPKCRIWFHKCSDAFRKCTVRLPKCLAYLTSAVGSTPRVPRCILQSVPSGTRWPTAAEQGWSAHRTAAIRAFRSRFHSSFDRLTAVCLWLSGFRIHLSCAALGAPGGPGGPTGGPVHPGGGGGWGPGAGGAPLHPLLGPGCRPVNWRAAARTYRPAL